jgi:hypothetical protein
MEDPIIDRVLASAHTYRDRAFYSLHIVLISIRDALKSIIKADHLAMHLNSSGALNVRVRNLNGTHVAPASAGSDYHAIIQCFLNTLNI